MSKVLLFGEGPNDVGRRTWSKRHDDFVTSDGWLQPMVRRLRGSEGSEDGARLRELTILPRRGVRPLQGLALKAQIAKLRAESEGYAAVVVATDADSIDPAVHASKLAEIQAGFDAISNRVVSVACVPMATSEAWLLADHEAWAALGAADFSEMPRRPEECWGRPHDPVSHHPKMMFGRVCDANDIGDHSDTRAALAEVSSFDEMERKLPVSFPPFRDAAGAI
ncbi:DUF4276 family protein [uncultured Sphingomonas sp.]|uniref:DUF4276 family protein n=1 Tax=uncultured Sphingomonas sp. TaxID=158754 RepID=UPI0025DC7684|nr:DUF4276 family protein [uncultured Sphingomonas sp.]